MAQRFKLFSDGSHPELFAGICRELSMNPGEVMIKEFSNGNIVNRIDEDVRGVDCFVFSTQAPPVSQHLQTMLSLVSNLKEHSDGKVTLVLGYMPYIRSDKEDQPRIFLAAKWMADQITLAGADRVILMDPHFPQIVGFFDQKKTKVEILGAKPLFCNMLKGEDEYDLSNSVCVAPDAGGAKEADRLAHRLDLPLAILDKRRVDNDERAEYRGVMGDIEGKDGIIVDDEFASLGTLIKAIKFMIKEGIKSIIAVGTHPVFSKPEALRELQEIKEFRQIIVTNTIPIPDEKRISKLRVEFTEDVWARAITCVHEGNSIRGKGGLLYSLYKPELFPFGDQDSS